MDYFGLLWIILRLAPEESVTSDHSHSEDSECFTKAQRAEVRPGHQSWKLRWSADYTETRFESYPVLMIFFNSNIDIL